MARGVLIWATVVATTLVVSPLVGTAAAESPRGKASGVKKPARVSKRARPLPGRRGEPVAAPVPAAPAQSPRVAAVEPAEAQPATVAARPGKPRVYTFGGLDVEGKLKAPQLLYFRSRMRQELDTSSSDTRSFLKELEKTADEKGL